MIDERSVERASERFHPPNGAFDRLKRRRDRRRRNRRITAGVVGFAVFLAAMWIVRDVVSLNRTAQRPAGRHASPAVEALPPVSAVGPLPEIDYLLDLNTGAMTPLPESITATSTRPPPDGWNNEYSASPDGSRLAYVAQGDNGESQIFVANLDGTAIQQVTHDLEAAFSPAWSPDGSRIAYTGHRGDHPDNIFVLDLATGTSTQITFETWDPDPPPGNGWPAGYGWQAREPSFTPDGSSIVYGAERWDTDGVGGEFETRMVPVAGGEGLRLMGGKVDGANAIGNPRLSPDGALLLYSCKGYSALCVASADGTEERNLLQSFDAAGSDGWSPDGTRIAVSTFHAQDVSILDVSTGQMTYVAEGSGPTWLDDHTLIIEIPRCYNPAIGGWGDEGCPG